MSEQLTVGRLIALLGMYDPDLLVEVEGCDCQGAAHGVGKWGTTVVICRKDELEDYE